MTDTIAHKRAVVDAYDEGLQQGTELALQAMELAKELEAENERLRHDLDVARAEVLRLTNPARPLAVGDRVRTCNGRVGTITDIHPECLDPYTVAVDGGAPGAKYWYAPGELDHLS